MGSKPVVERCLGSSSWVTSIVQVLTARLGGGAGEGGVAPGPRRRPDTSTASIAWPLRPRGAAPGSAPRRSSMSRVGRAAGDCRDRQRYGRSGTAARAQESDGGPQHAGTVASAHGPRHRRQGRARDRGVEGPRLRVGGRARRRGVPRGDHRSRRRTVGRRGRGAAAAGRSRSWATWPTRPPRRDSSTRRSSGSAGSTSSSRTRAGRRRPARSTSTRAVLHARCRRTCCPRSGWCGRSVPHMRAGGWGRIVLSTSCGDQAADPGPRGLQRRADRAVGVGEDGGAGPARRWHHAEPGRAGAAPTPIACGELGPAGRRAIPRTSGAGRRVPLLDARRVRVRRRVCGGRRRYAGPLVTTEAKDRTWTGFTGWSGWEDIVDWSR